MCIYILPLFTMFSRVTDTRGSLQVLSRKVSGNYKRSSGGRICCPYEARLSREKYGRGGNAKNRKGGKAGKDEPISGIMIITLCDAPPDFGVVGVIMNHRRK